MASGTEPLSYQWWREGTNAVVGDECVLGLLGLGASNVGAYVVVVSNAAGVVTSGVAVVSLEEGPRVVVGPSNVVVRVGVNCGWGWWLGSEPLSYRWYREGCWWWGRRGRSWWWRVWVWGMGGVIGWW
ncbi:hypothetical protein NXS98_08975 [Fontisphaera persica]|uniref:hypothetical protein n=1 Tax=Fontisphaera persica TaxID=2974023 RepID=UPI0024BF6AF1|nr:hypothetical protein [Fontisphaera persica]WCJ61283.1 hypothetical protein NXS98_08975 [Fontisphaera persica]